MPHRAAVNLDVHVASLSRGECTAGCREPLSMRTRDFRTLAAYAFARGTRSRKCSASRATRRWKLRCVEIHEIRSCDIRVSVIPMSVSASLTESAPPLPKNKDASYRVVCAAAQLDIVGSGGAARRERLNVVEFQHRCLVAATVRSDKRAAALISRPNLAADDGGNLSRRTGAGRGPARMFDLSSLPSLEVREEQRESAVEDLCADHPKEPRGEEAPGHGEIGRASHVKQ